MSEPVDASIAERDAGAPDAGMTDAGELDAGVFDAGEPDAGSVDAGVFDAGVFDAGVFDAGVFDAGVFDAGVFDAGVFDAGSVDAGPRDAGVRVVVLQLEMVTPRSISLRWDSGAPPNDVDLMRDGVVLAHLTGAQSSFEDLSADSGVLETIDAGASVGVPTGVALDWGVRASSGAPHRYSVVANFDEVSALSNEVIAARAPPTLTGWLITTADAGLEVAAGDRSWFDSSAPPISVPLINLGINARPDDATSSVVLSADASVPEVASTASYSIAPLTSDGRALGQGVTGSRGGHAVLQWQRSAGDTASGFVDLPRVHGPWWFDADAVFNEGRFYRLVVRNGSTDVFTSVPMRALLWRPRAMALSRSLCILRDDDETVCWWGERRGPLHDVIEFTTNGGEPCGLHSDGGVTCLLSGVETQVNLPPVSRLVGNGRLCGLSSTGWRCVGSDSPDVSSLATLDDRNWNNLICGRSAADGGRTCVDSAGGRVEWGDATAVGYNNGGACVSFPDAGLNCPMAPLSAASAPYASISMANYNAVTCGRRDDGLVRCAGMSGASWWGAAPPTSEYLFEQFAVEADYSERAACGLTLGEHRLRCGAIANMVPVLPPTAVARQIVTLSLGAMVLLDDGRLVGRGRAQVMEAPSFEDALVQVTVDPDMRWNFCGLHADGSAQCWSGGTLPQPAATDRFVRVQLVAGLACGLRVDGSITCWKGVWNPSGRFTELFTLDRALCGRRADGSLVCSGGWSHERPDTAFVQLASGSRGACGIRRDGRLECWPTPAPAATSQRRFRQVDASVSSLCALAIDGEVFCWGQLSEQSPFKDFTSISVGDVEACGIRADGTTICWPEADWYRLPRR